MLLEFPDEIVQQLREFTERATRLHADCSLTVNDHLQLYANEDVFDFIEITHFLNLLATALTEKEDTGVVMPKITAVISDSLIPHMTQLLALTEDGWIAMQCAVEEGEDQLMQAVGNACEIIYDSGLLALIKSDIAVLKQYGF